MNYHAAMVNQFAEREAQSSFLLPLLRATFWRYSLHRKIVYFAMKIRKIQNYLHNKIYLERARQIYLRKFWHVEFKVYKKQLAASTLVSDHIKLRKIEAFDEVFNESYVRKFLHLYTQRCRQIHTLAFFQFRAHRYQNEYK